jgi:hypothetical protein
VLRGGSPGTEPLYAKAGKREAGTRELITWVGTRAPIPNTLVPSAPRCVGLADLSVMPPQGERTHCSSYSIIYISCHGFWGCKLQVDMYASTTVAIPTKRAHPHSGRELSHEETPPVETHFIKETSYSRQLPAKQQQLTREWT